MLSQQLSAALARRSIHYGWVMVAVTFCAMLATASAMGMPGLLIAPLRLEFDWSKGAISGAMALRLVMFGAIGPFAAIMLRRLGVKLTIGIAMTLIVAGLGGAAFMDRAWELWLFWGLFVGVGTGMTAVVLGAAIATRWFTARRGLVIGILTASAASGQLVFLPAAAWMGAHFGWRMAVLPPVAACLLAAALVLLFGADHPGDLGLAPFGDEFSPNAQLVQAQLTQAQLAQARVANARAGATMRSMFDALGEAAAMPMFWVLFGVFAVCGFTTNGLIQTHFIPFCQDNGLSALDGAGLLALMGVFDFIGSIAAGYLADRFDNRWLLAAFFVLRGVALSVIGYGWFSDVGLAIFSVFYGLEWIATVAPTVKLSVAAFGRDRAPLVFGWIFSGHQIGAAAAAFSAGIIRETVGSYAPAFMVGSALCFAAALAAAPVFQLRARRASAATELRVGLS